MFDPDALWKPTVGLVVVACAFILVIVVCLRDVLKRRQGNTDGIRPEEFSPPRRV